MKIGILLAAGLLALPAATRLQDTAKVGAKIPAFSASAVSTVDSRATPVPTAYMIIGVNCGATPGYEKRFKALEDEFRSKGVDFVWLFPNKTESKDVKAGWMKKVGLRGGMVDDEGAKITKSLEIKQTAQIVLCDKDGTIVFRGGIDDNRDESAVKARYLATALQEHLAGKPVTTSSARSFG